MKKSPGDKLLFVLPDPGIEIILNWQDADSRVHRTEYSNTAACETCQDARSQRARLQIGINLGEKQGG